MNLRILSTLPLNQSFPPHLSLSLKKIAQSCLLLATLFPHSTLQAATPAFRSTPPSSRETAALPPTTPSANTQTTETSLPNTLPKGAYQVTPELGVPYSRIFRNTGPPYSNPLSAPPFSPSIRSGSVKTRLVVPPPNIDLNIPILQRGFEPQDADLKIGPVFFKLRSLSGATLWSNNINLTENDPQTGTIAITTLNASVIAQLTEGLRLAFTGSLIYLPLVNEIGITGFGQRSHAPFIFGLSQDPNFRSETTWNTNIAGWNVLLSNNFIVDLGRYQNNYRNDAIIFRNGGFTGSDTAGRYTFGPGDRNVPLTDSQINQQTTSEVLFYSNTISAQADRKILGDTRLRFIAAHTNLWYNQGNRGLPSLRDQLSVVLNSERENLRFKPFLIYSALRTDLQVGFGQTVRLGIDGPITDQLQLHAETGSFFFKGENTFLWRLILTHQAGPYTQESLYFGRFVSIFQDQTNEVIGYNIRQVIGPKIILNGLLSRNKVINLVDDAFSRVEYRAGANIQIRVGPRTRITLTGFTTLADSDLGYNNTWTSIAEIDHFFTDTFQAQLLTQYQQRSSDYLLSNYSENLFYLSFTKYFN